MHLTIIRNAGHRHRAPCEGCGTTTHVERVEARLSCIGLQTLDLCRRCRGGTDGGLFPDTHWHVVDTEYRRAFRTASEAEDFARRCLQESPQITSEPIVAALSNRVMGTRLQQSGMIDVLECSAATRQGEG